MELGPRENALKVQIEHNLFGDYIKMADKYHEGELSHQFDCSMGKYHYDNGVVIYWKHCGGN